jgi:hypothetical protein
MMQFDVYRGVNFFVTDCARKGNSDESARWQRARQEGESHEFPLQTETGDSESHITFNT